MSVMSAIILQEDLPYANSLKDMLDKTSYVKVLCSTNDGQMGLDLINKYSPDLVILDLILKTMDGLEILPEILPISLNPVNVSIKVWRVKLLL